MDGKNDKILDTIGESGFPFQKEIEKILLENNCLYYPHQTEVPLSLPSEYNARNFVPPTIDIVLSYANRPSGRKWSVDILVECKKAFEKDWYFFSKLSGSYYKEYRVPISAAIMDKSSLIPKSISIFYGCTEETPIKPPVCDNVLETKKGGYRDGRAIVYDTCGTLSVALIHFLVQAEMTMRQLSDSRKYSDDVTVVIPMIVTTANLHIIDSKGLSVDFRTGKLDTSTVNISDVEWLFFSYPMAPDINVKSSDPYELPDHSKELATKMGCIIVNANYLIPFLNRFSPHHIEDLVDDFITYYNDRIKV